MLEGISIDQLRVFIAAAQEGSFSAAGRKLNRAQSAVSQTIANLEFQLGVPLFEREKRYPVLTESGQLLLADARAVICGVTALKARAQGMAAGLEPELSVAIDVMFPMAVLTRAAAAFGAKFTTTPLRLYVEALGGVAKAVIDGQCRLGVMGSLALITPDLATERLLRVKLVFVAAPAHPLARISGKIGVAELAQHSQLVLTDRSDLSKGREFAVLSPRNWRLADLGAKHAFLLAGLGWGGMPYAMVERDIVEGALKILDLQDFPILSDGMQMLAAYRSDTPPGPAGRWFLDQLKQLAKDEDQPGMDATPAPSAVATHQPAPPPVSAGVPRRIVLPS